MSFPRYPTYKPSGVAWLGDVPGHWEVCALNYRYEIALGKMLDEKRITGEHLAPYLRNIDVQWDRINVTDLPQMDFEETDRIRYGLRRGDLLVCEGGEVGRAAVWDQPIDECYYQKALHRIRPRSDDHDSVRFLFHLFRTASSVGTFVAGEGKSTIAHLTAEALRRYRFPFPPLAEQTRIAEFLDGETAKIDELVAEQRRLMELLKEKRQAVISHAVTRGLNPHAPLKPSGLEWLGDIPAQWKEIKLGFISRTKGGAGFPDEHQGQTDNEIPFFKVGDLSNADGGRVMRQANHTISEETAKELRAFVFPTDTIVFAKVGAALLLRRYRLLGQSSCIDNNMMGMTVGSEAAVDFLLYILPLLDLSLIVNPGAVPSINEGQISSQRIPLPPLAEQTAIVRHLDAETAKFDALTAEAQRAIDLLQERRTALISAAVTGQIDVRAAAVPPPSS